MQRLCEMMSEYFDGQTNKKGLLSEASGPVVPQVCRWIVHESPERFYREFEFSNYQQVSAFISEILKYQIQANHMGVQKIEGNKVSVEVYTHDINRITELDQEYARQIDLIYRDVLDFGL